MAAFPAEDRTVLKVYGDSISGNCLKVKWVAEKLGAQMRETIELPRGMRPIEVKKAHAL